MFLLLICILLRVIDIFVLRLDEPPVNEIILSKTLGLLLLILFLQFTNQGFGEIGFNSHNIIQSIIIGMLFLILALSIIYGSQIIYLKLKGAQPYISLQSYTILIFIWSAFTWHFFMNFTQNILVIKSSNFIMDPSVLITSSTTVKGVSMIAAFLAIITCVRYFK